MYFPQTKWKYARDQQGLISVQVNDAKEKKYHTYGITTTIYKKIERLGQEFKNRTLWKNSGATQQ